MTARYWSGSTLAMLLLSGLCFWASRSWELEPGSWAGAGMGFLICAAIDFVRAARAAQPVDGRKRWLEEKWPPPDWGAFDYRNKGCTADSPPVQKLSSADVPQIVWDGDNK